MRTGIPPKFYCHSSKGNNIHGGDVNGNNLAQSRELNMNGMVQGSFQKQGGSVAPRSTFAQPLQKLQVPMPQARAQDESSPMKRWENQPYQAESVRVFGSKHYPAENPTPSGEPDRSTGADPLPSSGDPLDPVTSFLIQPGPGDTVYNHLYPDQIQSPNPPAAVYRQSNNFPDSNRGKRPLDASTSVSDRNASSEYDHLFDYEDYSPPLGAQGKRVGTRSMDHYADSELPTTFATYLFQNDPITHWNLRDVAEKVPTKIREKEMKYTEQLGAPESVSGEVNSSNIMQGLETTIEPTFSGYSDTAGTITRRKKRVKREQLERKGRRNWISNYEKKFPGQPVPSPLPNWRQTVHALLHVGKSNNGPQDFNTRIVMAIKRCQHESFRNKLIAKLESYSDPCSSTDTTAMDASGEDNNDEYLPPPVRRGALTDASMGSAVRRMDINRNTGMHNTEYKFQISSRKPSSIHISPTQQPYGYSGQNALSQGFFYNNGVPVFQSGMGMSNSAYLDTRPPVHNDNGDDRSSYISSNSEGRIVFSGAAVPTEASAYSRSEADELATGYHPPFYPLKINLQEEEFEQHDTKVEQF